MINNLIKELSQASKAEGKKMVVSFKLLLLFLLQKGILTEDEVKDIEAQLPSLADDLPKVTN
jgi:hypothetical protein